MSTATHTLIVLRTKSGKTYLLAEDGTVIGRSDGPKGWNYSGRWIITGLVRRWHSARAVSLIDALNGEDFGHGFIRDLDHGTRRQSSERADTLRAIDANGDEAASLRRALGVPS